MRVQILELVLEILLGKYIQEERNKRLRKYKEQERNGVEEIGLCEVLVMDTPQQ